MQPIQIRIRITRFLFIFSMLSACIPCHSAESTPTAVETQSEMFVDGIVYECPGRNINALAEDVNSFFKSLGIVEEQVLQSQNTNLGLLKFTLVGSQNSTDTLDLINRRELHLKEELVQLPSATKKPKSVITVSKKEIVMSMLQRGRTSKFSGNSCSLEALKDQVGVRQNIVAWTDSVTWRWPNGRTAKWNQKYWNHGNLKSSHPLHEAINDVFIHPDKYSFGCYTATKLIVIQGVLDYYRRIKRDVETSALLEKRLMQDGDPLSYIEPGAMWFFESDVTAKDLNRQGKLLYLQKSIPANNFIPGDWSYFLNTDPVTYQKTGYEGSNAIYLGRGKLDDYYHDNSGSYTYKAKLNEVFQWRNHVFSRKRDAAKTKPLTADELDTLSNSPDNGGLQLEYRAVPYLFNFEELPVVN